jgi:purine-binding chemotaxis protein CheW
MRIRSEDRERIMGVVVDAVSDVYEIPEAEQKPPPASVNNAMIESVRSLATVDEKMIIILDIDHLLNTQEMVVLDEATE